MKRFGLIAKTANNIPAVNKNIKGKLNRENDPEFLKRKARIARFGSGAYIDALRQTKRSKN